MIQKNIEEILSYLQSFENEANRKGMARYGINTEKAFGVGMSILKPFAKTIGKDHPTALRLWDTGWHEARLLAGLIAEPDKADDALLERWVNEIDSWDICDLLCKYFITKTLCVSDKIILWTTRDHEFTKRAGFVLMAEHAIHAKNMDNEAFMPYLTIIEREAADNRNFVKKAINWALRQMGKRNKALHVQALMCAERLLVVNSPSARWIARDAIRELNSDAVKKKIYR